MKIVIILTTNGTIIFDNDTRIREMLIFPTIKILLLGLVFDGIYSDDIPR